MLTCSERLNFVVRQGTACLLALILGGLSGCDQSSTPTASSSADNLAPATPPSSERTPLRETPPATSIPPADNRPRIIAFGDSLTAGLGVIPEQSYPTQLQKQLDALGYHYQVLNAGVSGDTSAGGLRRVSWVLAGKPRVVILELGGNDGLRGLGLPETRSHLDAIIRQLQDARVQVILAGMKLPPNYGEEYTARFEAMYRDLAQLHGLPLIPFLLEGVGGEKSLNQADGIHPTGDGYRIVVENVLRSLLPVLKDTSTNSSAKKKKT
ncbi:MAG: arylesterase [Nitrospira sp.]|nr:arylesterase [Nitrospira sp.]MBP6604745.1 arylesterase [Nitrospira sp.]HQY56149.1 arylesterase [Nitrospira sp.]HRA97236.1 arylesterase [Nitrospira sp.]